MTRLRLYYQALSSALLQGAFATPAPANPRVACAAARETRATFLPASPYPNLAPFYAAPLQRMDGWLAAHCSAP